MFKKTEPLFKKMNMKTLRFLCKNPTKSYYERELAQEAGVSLGSANAVLKDLASLDMVSMERKGNLRLYKIALRNPVARQLKVLFTVDSLYPLIRKLREHSTKIILFGSSSRGTDTEESDIDLFMITKDKKMVMVMVSAFREKTERSITPIVMTMNEYLEMKKSNKALFDNISMGIILWDKNGL